MTMLSHQQTSYQLSNLDLKSMSSGYGTPHRNASIDGHPLTLAGVTYPSGVGTHAESEYAIDLGGYGARFTAKVGLDDETAKRGAVVFIVYVDGKLAAKSPVMRSGTPVYTFDVDLKSAKTLRLVVGPGGGGIDWAHADWADANIVMADAKHKPKPKAIPVEPLINLAPVDKVHTAINGPRVLGFTPTHPFLFRIPASGQRPLTYTAAGLPKGLHLDAKRGIISGRVSDDGTWKVKVTASGPKGSDSRTLTLIAGDHKLAQTPPMGWNSWNVWAGAIDGQKVKDAADCFIKTGLADYGYQYVNIDDCWEAGRDEAGKIQPNAKFKDMPAVSQYVHNFGLKFGIYSSPGPLTCAGFTASYKHELQDAQSYASWGVDYLKYDWCSYGNIAPNPDLAALKLPYLVMSEALSQTDRDIVFSLCQYGMGDVWNWGGTVGGNLWRTTGDINDSWGSMSGIGFSHSERANGVSPGHWNDPDMLVVGKLGWGAHPRPTHLTPNEQVTHITLWSMLAAPLIIGCDLTQIDDLTERLLMNHDVIEIDQDPLGKAATRRAVDGDAEVWARPLWDGTTAVALFNRGVSKRPVTVTWASLGLKGSLPVRDLWARKDLGSKAGSLTVAVPRHGAMLFRVGKIQK